MSHIARHLRPRSRVAAAVSGLGVVLMVGATTLAATVGPASATDNGDSNGNSNDKQTICHRTDANKNQYIVNTPNKNGDVDGHASQHQGPIWNPTLKDQHIEWGDIIPPFDYNDHGEPAHFPGLNWTAYGQAIFAADCTVPEPKLAVTIVKVNDANGDGTFTDSEAAAGPAQNVPFKVTITNPSTYLPVTVVSLTDLVGVTPVVFTCAPPLVGTVLAPLSSTTCSFTVPAYSPAAGGLLTNVATVVVAQAASEAGPADATNTATANDSSIVTTPAVTATEKPSPTPTATTASPTPTATATTASPTPTASQSETPETAPDLAVVKTGPATANPGDTLTYTLSVTNTGNATALAATLTDPLPTGVNLTSVSGLGWDCTALPAVSCSATTPILAGATSLVTVVGTLDAEYAADTVVNTAVVGPTDETPGDNTSTVTTTIENPFTGGSGGGVVQEPLTPTTSGGGGGSGLPFTGAPIGMMMQLGQLLVVLGGILAVGGRRRRPDTSDALTV